MSNTLRQVPDWMLERYALGELSASEAKQVADAVATDPQLAEQLASLSASNDDILARYPVTQEVAVIKARAAQVEATPMKSARVLGGRWNLALALPAVAAVAFLVVARNVDDVTTPDAQQQVPGLGVSDTRVKGDAHLVLRRKVGSEAEVLDSTAKAHAGDLIQLAYVAGGKRYGAIVSWDGRGSVTLHFPTEPYVDTLLSQQGEVLLPTSYELDDAPSFERFVLVTADTPIDLDLVMRRAEALAQKREQAATGPLTLPAHYEQISFLLKKVERAQ